MGVISRMGGILSFVWCLMVGGRGGYAHQMYSSYSRSYCLATCAIVVDRYG
jgi:hypothetical protein